jgi:cell division protein FtsB
MARKSKRVDVGIWMKLTKLVMLLVICAGSLAVFQWYKPVIRSNEGMQRRINQLRAQIAEEERFTEQINATIKAIGTNNVVLERLAREKLGYAKPGEKVIRFETINGQIPSK